MKGQVLIMVYVGIDSGSVSTKAALLDENNQMSVKIIPTGWSPREASKEVFNLLLDQQKIPREEVAFIVGTGYGRISMDFVDKQITEITCHAKGAFYLNDQIRTVIDIGGQDSKIIRMDDRGNVKDFLMNDKCAAGTGRFLQVMMNTLGADISEIDSLYTPEEMCSISSMCTVFAESEVVSLLAGGKSKQAITSGILESIASRTVSMLSKSGYDGEVAFNGGVARSTALRGMISNKLGTVVHTSDMAQFAGAIGAAILARDFARKSQLSD